MRFMSDCPGYFRQINVTVLPFVVILRIFPARADWLVADCPDQSSVNSNEVTCNARAFSTGNKANSARIFSMLF